MRLDTYYETSRVHHPSSLFVTGGTYHRKTATALHFIKAQTVLHVIQGPTAAYTDILLQSFFHPETLQTSEVNFIKPGHPFGYFRHSCDPNCGINESLQLVTIRDIKAGEELCWDYATYTVDYQRTYSCDCNTAKCRRIIGNFDLVPGVIQQHYLSHKIVMPYLASLAL
jgi:hypothetical protein